MIDLNYWLEPGRRLDDLDWVYKRSFISFVVGCGVIQFGLCTYALWVLWLAFDSHTAIPVLNLRVAMLIWLIVGAIWAATVWLLAWWHFRDRQKV